MRIEKKEIISLIEKRHKLDHDQGNITNNTDKLLNPSSENFKASNNFVLNENKKNYQYHENTYPFLIFSFVNSSQAYLAQLKGKKITNNLIKTY